MVFDWENPVSYSADVINGELVLRFDRPVKGDFRSLLRPLAKYLRGVSVSSDRQTATFPLTHPVQVKAFIGNGNAVIVDLMDKTDESSRDATPRPVSPTPGSAQPDMPSAATPPQDGPLSLLPQQPTGVTSAPTPASVPASPPTEPSVPSSTPTPMPSGASVVSPKPRSADPPLIEIRSGEHGSYNRLVFTWPQAVDYKVEKQGGRATVTFTKPARFDLPALQSALPSDISALSADGGAKSATVVLSVPGNARLRHFISGNKVVLDVVRDANAAPPASAAAAPLAPPPESDVALPALKPLVQEDKPKLPSESLAMTAPASGPSPVKPTLAPKEQPKEQQKAGQVSSSPVAPPSTANEKPTVVPPRDAEPPPSAPAPRPPVVASSLPADNDKVFSLSVSWEKPVAAAVFRRAGYLWLVFDRKQEVDTKLLRRLGGEAVSAVEQIANRDATVLRLVVQADYAPSVRRDGLLWVIDLMHQPAEPKDPIPVIAPTAVSNGIGIILNVAEAGNVVTVADPEIGDTMQVVPVITLGAGVYPGRDTPDVELLSTVQGIAIVPHVDGLDVRSTRGSVTIGLPTGPGLRLSSDANHPMTSAKRSASEGFFDVGTWKRGGPEAFAGERRVFEAGLALIPPSGRSGAHMEAAQFFFANGFAAEALGFLRLAADEEPTLVDTGPYRALRGACQFLMGRWDLAMADLDNPLVKDDPESRVWQAAAHASASDTPPASWNKALAAGLPIFGNYPEPLAWPLAVISARAAMAAGDDDAAQKSMDILDRSLASARKEVQLDYLHGMYNEMAGQFDRAIDDYDHAASGNNREYRAKASLAEIELLLKMGRITPQVAAERLDRLRFSWREEDFEFGLLKRLGELQIQAGDYANALRTMRSLLNNYPDNKGTPDVSKMMSDNFAKLYLDGGADAMSPVSAIGLYDEFRDLTPTGAKGDEMIRKLADRLAGVDLLDRAAELLKHQVSFRLQGLDKARVGAQLALLDLLNQQPQPALDALMESETSGLPTELQSQRKHLKARALADLNRVPEAIQLLVGDASGEATQLRAEIYWRKQDWPNAALALEAMVPRPGPGVILDDVSARLVVNWATALALSNDERGLAAIRRNFGPALVGTPYQDGFTLLTSALDRDLPDMPAIAMKIKEAEGFQTFMSNFKKRMQSGGLSGIN
jgi:tetratricopeptide (TPR) repeat protein